MFAFPLAGLKKHLNGKDTRPPMSGGLCKENNPRR